MSKKTKKKKPAPFGQPVMDMLKAKVEVKEKEPSFNELWEQAVEAIQKLEKAHSEEYWAKAVKTKYVPVLFPRRKNEQIRFDDNLLERGVRIKIAGPAFKYGDPIQSEVEGIYRSLMEERLILFMKVKFKKQVKLKDLSKEEKTLLNLHRYGKNTWKKWWPLFRQRFMKKYHSRPEDHKPFYCLVRLGIEGQVDNPPTSLPKDGEYADSLYREAIKKMLEQAVKAYANQPYELKT